MPFQVLLVQELVTALQAGPGVLQVAVNVVVSGFDALKPFSTNGADQEVAQ